jgi:hypothetical protein
MTAVLCISICNSPGNRKPPNGAAKGVEANLEKLRLLQCINFGEGVRLRHRRDEPVELRCVGR